MCFALPAKVIETRGDMAVVTASGATREISTVAVPDLEPGDHVLLSFGMAVERITEDEALEIQRTLDDLSEFGAREGDGLER